MTKIITLFACLNGRSFLHFFTFLLLFYTSQSFAQKDVACQLLEPLQGQDIFPKDSFNLKVLITNVGTEEITPIEPVSVAAYVGTFFVYSDYVPVYIPPGQSYVFEKMVSYNFTGNHPNEPFCVTLTILFAQEDNLSNNMDCHAVDLMQSPTSSEYILNNNIIVNLTPNPTQGNIHIAFDKSIKDNLQLNLFNSNGSLQYSKLNLDNDQNIDISHLAKGIYYAVIKGEKSYATKKLILQ